MDADQEAGERSFCGLESRVFTGFYVDFGWVLISKA